LESCDPNEGRTQLLTITDSGNNQPKAFYDDLGRKTEVDDPDRGIWLYTWDGLGRVRTQKDARGITVAYQYDAVGRMERRFIQQQAGASFVLEANWQYDLNNKLGTVGAMYGVPDNTADVALDLTQPDTMFQREYKYDALLRPWSIATHAPGESTWAAQDFTIEYGVDPLS
jgi:YD repeat-containing protein